MHLIKIMQRRYIPLAVDIETNKYEYVFSPFGARLDESRLSVGSLEIYVRERLKDAPPK